MGVFVPLTGCVEKLSSNQPEVEFSGRLSTKEPLLEKVEVVSEKEYPNHYSGYLTSEQDSPSLRTEYISEEHPLIADDVVVDGKPRYPLVIFGKRLPEDVPIRVSEMEFADGKLSVTYEYRSSSTSSKTCLQNHLMVLRNAERVRTYEPLLKLK